jgi:hypothetical protein
MTRLAFRFRSCLAVLGAVMVVMGGSYARAGSCDEAARELQRKWERLSDSVEALRDAHRSGDLSLVHVFSHKISQQVEELREFQENTPCPGLKASQSSRNLSPVKTDVAPHQDEPCNELRRMHMKLVITINSLRRRQNSVFSQLTAQEQEDLTRSGAELEQIREVLRSRCPAERTKPRPRGVRPSVEVKHGRP